ncbi:hypothetical protein [Pseudomonas sp. 24 E 13]|nr:hypothetical protein [Pseudomonas sp. 24 E 13]
MQGRHALLAHRVEARQGRLGAGDGVVVQVGDQFIGGFPGLLVGFTHDHMQANAEAQGAPELVGLGPHLRDLFRHRCRWFAPGQHHFNLFGRQVLGRLGRPAKIQRRAWLLDRRVEQFGALDADVLAVVIHGFAFKHAAPDAGEFHRGLVALFVTEEQAVAGQFLRVTAGDQVEQCAAAGEAIQGRGLTCGYRRGNDPGAQRDKKFQTLGHGDQRGRHQPGVFAGAPGRDQHPAEAQAVGGLCHLLQVTVIDGASAFGGAEVMTVAVGRQEPENIEAHGVVS